MRSPAKDLAVVYLTAGGELRLQPDALRAGLTRAGSTRAPAPGRCEPAADGSFLAADTDDWVLLFR